MYCDKHKKHDKKRRFFEEEFRLQRCYVSVARLTAVTMLLRTSLNSVAKVYLSMYKYRLYPLNKYRRDLDEKIDITSTNRGFRTNNHIVATYEQVRKTLLILSKKNVENDEIHTTSLFVR